MDLSEIKNIVFDLGGVIITLDRERSVRRFIEIGLENADDLLDAYHQKGVFQHLEEGLLSESEFYDAIRAEAGKYISDEDIEWAWMGFIIEAQVYKLKMLEDLRAKGYTLYLLSNTNPVVMKWAMSPNFSSEGKPLSDYFDKLYLSYQMKSLKPRQDIFEQLITDSGLIPSETLFVDDGTANVEIGKALGFKTFQPKNGEDFREIFN
ncbi:MAG: HAD family phosphatase [Candidatus Symbiothrix sp.]|jgi:putative hydrolase of the HAD superfamily|nr:HAD family phosphatase [Candidatus Symbiothrix sp.]